MNKRRLKLYELKYQGKSAEEQAEESGYSLTSIYRHLAPSGKWYSEYSKYEDDMNKAAIKRAKKRMEKWSDGASEVLVAQLGLAVANPKVAQKAAFGILDRIGLGPSQKIETENPEDVADRIVNKLKQSRNEK